MTAGRPSLDELLSLMRRLIYACEQLEIADNDPTMLPSEAVERAEAVSLARIALYTALIGQGWTAPLGLLDQIAWDQTLRREPLGNGYDGPGGPRP